MEGSKTPLIKKLFAGGTLSTMLIGLLVEARTQLKTLETDLTVNRQEIAILKTENHYRDEALRELRGEIKGARMDIKEVLKRLPR